MRRFRLVAMLLGVIFLASTTLIMSSASVEARGQNHVKNKFIMVENPTFTPATGGLSGSGKLDLNTKKDEYKLKIRAEGLEPGTVYRVTQTVRHSTSGLASAVIILDVEVTADKKGRIKFKTNHVALDADLLEATGAPGVGPNWRIDQQVRLAGSGDPSGVCMDCILVCAPTTKIHIEDGKIVEGWLPS